MTMNDAIREAASIIQRANVQKAEELQAAREAYRALLLADDARPGDGSKLVDALTALGLTVSDALADAKAIVARQKVEAEIAEKNAESVRLAGEAKELQKVIDSIVKNSRTYSGASDRVAQKQALYNAAERIEAEIRKLSAKLAGIRRDAPRIFGNWK
jgi:DNA repair exonuclease SbcCD ATPase subunit